MLLLGKHFIAGEQTATSNQTFVARNPATNEELPPRYPEATSEEIDQCLNHADQAFSTLQLVESSIIADLLDDVAIQLEQNKQGLIERAHAETALATARLESELGRTVNQTRFFAKLVLQGEWIQARIDRGDPARKPLPKPDVRTMLMGIGPVVVFGASNFPFAISVAGTDTIAALAAKCPVIVKAHPGHPGTCELVAEIITKSVEKAGLPRGTFSMLYGATHAVGMSLVEHPMTAAVAFTGSLQGGRALFDAACRRPRPIPVYAEMGSTNPVFVLPGAASEQAEQIAAGYVQSVTLGVGQFCTNPGMLFIQESPSFDVFAKAAKQAAEAAGPGTMLHSSIHKAYEEGLERLAKLPDIEVLTNSASEQNNETNQAACTILLASASSITEHPQLAEEIFGPTSIVFRCRNIDQMLAFARQMDGQLTATIHGTKQELANNAELVQVLQQKVGRLVFNGFPTGIEVCTAMHHGGPYPATTHSYFTSIGPSAIYRFTKPVCFQNFPDAALPESLRNRNTGKIPRLVDGMLSYDDI